MRKRDIKVGHQYRLKRPMGGKVGPTMRVVSVAAVSSREAVDQAQSYVPDGIVTVESVGLGSAIVTSGERRQPVQYTELFPLENKNPSLWREAVGHPLTKWALIFAGAAFVVGTIVALLGELAK